MSKRIKILTIFLLILLAMLFFWFSKSLMTPKTEVNSIKTISTSTPPVLTEEMLATFSASTIEKRCPFYKPNGSEYRDCLSTWVDELEDELLIEQLDEVQNYCSTFIKKVSDENSIEGGELYLRCEIYKLQ